MFQVAFALEMCEDTREINTNCTMITPVVTGCALFNYSVYNMTGDSVLSGNLTNFTKDVYQFNFTLGEGDYLVKLCDDTTREIRVKQEDENKMIIAVIILLPMLLGLFLLILAASLDNEDHAALKIGLGLLSLITFWVSLHFGMVSVVKFYDFTELQDLIGTTVYWYGLTFFVIVCYFGFYAFMKITHRAAQKKEERLNY